MHRLEFTMLNLEVQFLNGSGGRSERSNLVRIFCSGRTLLLYTCLSEPLNRQVEALEQREEGVVEGQRSSDAHPLKLT